MHGPQRHTSPMGSILARAAQRALVFKGRWRHGRSWPYYDASAVAGQQQRDALSFAALRVGLCESLSPVGCVPSPMDKWARRLSETFQQGKRDR